MSNKFKIAVIGPIPRDHITTHEGKTVEKFGCAIYTSVVLSSLVGSGSTIYNVSHVQETDVDTVKQILQEFPYMDVSNVTSSADQGDVIRLKYLDQNRRVEKQSGFMNPILPADLEGLMDCDAFVFVPITDFEVPLETLRFIKENSDALIVFDAHGPTNGCSKHGDRFHKFWIDRDRWLPYIDLLKMNLEEAKCSWFDGEYEVSEMKDIGELTMDELPRFAQHCLDHGVKGVFVTLDQHGCAVYFKDDADRMREHLVKRVLVEHVVDTTGCGDSFAGGVTYGFLKTGDFVKACQFGNCAGAQRCRSTELDVYGSLEETEREIQETYG